ncbi:hypothetical protein CFC21_045932 [Triticum aestivum]|uniref:Uncharacterized protein n=2 Tax=Triticum aestivum TaxID=4565 RepID=A0A9R1FUP2_WHEAT|nr:uncharacterized protein LOC123077184 [Triticum aestivum]KAF7034984.1 hypothetical protein CFC21_045932 [Triticum aestivum]
MSTSGSSSVSADRDSLPPIPCTDCGGHITTIASRGGSRPGTQIYKKLRRSAVLGWFFRWSDGYALADVARMTLLLGVTNLLVNLLVLALVLRLFAKRNASMA